CHVPYINHPAALRVFTALSSPPPPTSASPVLSTGPPPSRPNLLPDSLNICSVCTLAARRHPHSPSIHVRGFLPAPEVSRYIKYLLYRSV
ncbi:hypothetical protein C8R44DRAFT_987026, partial [Mycena epipterygia]